MSEFKGMTKGNWIEEGKDWLLVAIEILHSENICLSVVK